MTRTATAGPGQGPAVDLGGASGIPAGGQPASTQWAARNAITAAGLTVGSVTMSPSCQAFRGSVLTQSPGGGTRIVRGSAVNLTESTGKLPNGKTCPIA